MEKKSFVLYGDYREHFALLSAEEQGQLLMAIFAYVEEGTQPDLSPAAMMAFSFIRLQLDRDEARYAETCQKRQEAGKKSGETRRNKREQKQETGTLVPFVQQTGTNGTDNENETDTENENENENDTVTESVPPKSPQGGLKAPSPLLRRLLPHYALQIELQDKIDKWVHYKQERGEGYKSQGLMALLRQLETHAAHYGSSAVCDLMDESMAAGWKSIPFDRLKAPPAVPRPYGKKAEYCSFTDLVREGL